MISRTAADWRSLPTLTVRETAELVGLSAQTVEAKLTCAHPMPSEDDEMGWLEDDSRDEARSNRLG